MSDTFLRKFIAIFLPALVFFALFVFVRIPNVSAASCGTCGFCVPSGIPCSDFSISDCTASSSETCSNFDKGHFSCQWSGPLTGTSSSCSAGQRYCYFNLASSTWVTDQNCNPFPGSCVEANGSATYGKATGNKICLGSTQWDYMCYNNICSGGTCTTGTYVQACGPASCPSGTTCSGGVCGASGPTYICSGTSCVVSTCAAGSAGCFTNSTCGGACAISCTNQDILNCQAANPGYCRFSDCEYVTSRCNTPGVCYYGNHSTCAAAGIACPVCGDGKISTPEQCDNGPLNGTCGNPGVTCASGTCTLCSGSSPPPPSPVCGDGICNGTESCSTCPGDCGVCSAPPPSPPPPPSSPPPSVTTNAPTGLTGTGATLNGSVNPNNSSTNAWFRWSSINPGTCDNSFGTATATTGPFTGSSFNAYSSTISGLTSGTTYYYCAIAQNAGGIAYGSIIFFVSNNGIPPTVTTNPPTNLTGTSATLNGTANPNGNPTTGWFRYSATNPGTCNDTFGTRVALSNGSSEKFVSAPISSARLQNSSAGEIIGTNLNSTNFEIRNAIKNFLIWLKQFLQ